MTKQYRNKLISCSMFQKYTLIPIRNLVSNQEYQRNLSQNHVQRAAANFDLYQINPVKVSRRNGINYVFNGQHTIEIVALVSGSRETPVWCMVYDDLVYEHEADIFANQMKYVKPLLPYEIFMANIEAGNDKQLIIRDLIESYDLSITSSSVPGGICAVATLETIHDKYGYHMLDHVIRLIVATWEGAAQSFSANMMNGLARFLNAYGDAGGYPSRNSPALQRTGVPALLDLQKQSLSDITKNAGIRFRGISSTRINSHRRKLMKQNRKKKLMICRRTGSLTYLAWMMRRFPNDHTETFTLLPSKNANSYFFAPNIVISSKTSCAASGTYC